MNFNTSKLRTRFFIIFFVFFKYEGYFCAFVQKTNVIVYTFTCKSLCKNPMHPKQAMSEALAKAFKNMWAVGRCIWTVWKQPRVWVDHRKQPGKCFNKTLLELYKTQSFLFLGQWHNDAVLIRRQLEGINKTSDR